MPGKLILSLDCEGKWGVADILTATEHARLSDARLREAYEAIIGLFDEFGVPATFAFTECFLLTRDALLSLPADEITERLPYTRNAFQDLRSGSMQGWSAPWIADRLSDRHEIACHGVTHSPWGSMTEDQARFDLALVPQPRGRTFIFPRNEIAHLNVLREHGFAGFRLASPRRSRMASLATEFDPWQRAEPDPPPSPDLQPIPGGYFINWLAGPRRLVPRSLTRLRARRIMLDAARTGGVAHFWTHPENIASAPRTLDNLRGVLEEATELRRAGRIEIVTQRDYCLSLAGEAAESERPSPSSPGGVRDRTGRMSRRNSKCAA